MESTIKETNKTRTKSRIELTHEGGISNQACQLMSTHSAMTTEPEAMRMIIGSADNINQLEDLDPEQLVSDEIFIDSSRFYPLSLIYRPLKEKYKDCTLLRFNYTLPSKRGRVYITIITGHVTLNIDISKGLDHKFSEIIKILGEKQKSKSLYHTQSTRTFSHKELYYHLSDLIWV